MKRRPAKRQPQNPAPAQLAREAANAWVENMGQSYLAHLHGSAFDADLIGAFDTIAEAVRGGPRDDLSLEQENVVMSEYFVGLEAGYLLGLQIGLRLRAVPEP